MNATSEKFLIVDDKAEFRKKIIEWLVELTRLELADILEASDGKDALVKLEASPQIKDILCDIAMKPMNGVAFAEAISDDGRGGILKEKELNPTFWTSLISKSIAKILNDDFNIGGDRYLKKPKKIEEFLEILKKHFPHLLKKISFLFFPLLSSPTFLQSPESF